MTRYKFGDIVEWETARWMIVRWTGLDTEGTGPNENGYEAIWLGHDKPTSGVNPYKPVGETGAIAVVYGEPYLVETDG